MTYRLPSLNTLRAFEAAARHASFKTAADELGVTAGAVSQQVKKLESSLGVTLFRRLPHGLVLTAQAETYLPAANNLHLKWRFETLRLNRSKRLGLQITC